MERRAIGEDNFIHEVGLKLPFRYIVEAVITGGQIFQITSWSCNFAVREYFHTDYYADIIFLQLQFVRLMVSSPNSG